MYLAYWGLHSAPFVNAPNKNIFYLSPQHEEALHRLLYVVEYRKGVAMISGEVGCGKTTLIRALPNHLSNGRVDLHMIPNPALSPVDLIRAILMRMGDNGAGESKTMLLDRLQRVLEARAKQEIETVLAIDEAHVISDNKTLDELRMLLNFQSEDQFLITLILLGQPPLLKKISELHPLNERLSMKVTLEPLDFKETGKYILYRLRLAGARRGIFSKEAVEVVYQKAKGIPLRINNICDRSLLIGLMQRSPLVTSRIVKTALSDLA